METDEGRPPPVQTGAEVAPQQREATDGKTSDAGQAAPPRAAEQLVAGPGAGIAAQIAANGGGGGMREPGAANGDTAAAAAETIGEEDLAADELRPLAENLGFNLTSVLANPRETDSIFDFDPYLLLTEGFFSSEEGDQFDPSKLPPPPIPLPNITFESLAPFMDRTGDLQARFMRNHGDGGASRDESEPGSPRRGDMALAPEQVFREVPALFQHKNFSLAEPRIFAKVVSESPEERQEQLTSYLDLVEVCLLHQISSRQDAFFEALSNLQALQKDVTVACSKVHTLRTGVRGMQANMVSGTMKVPQLARRKGNLMDLQAVLEQVTKVTDARDAVEALFTAEDFAGALGLIAEAQRTIKEHLQGVKCVEVIAKQLTDYEQSATKFLATQFVNVAIADTTAGEAANLEDERGDEAVDAGAAGVGGGGGGGEGGGGGGAAACLSAADRRRVTHVVGSLVRIGGMAEALDKHRRRLEESIKLVVRIAVQEYVYSAGGEVPGAGGGSGGDDNAKLGARLCSLDAGSFKDCLEMSFSEMLEALTRAQAVHEVLTQCFNEQKEGAKDNGTANGKNEGEGGAEKIGSGGTNEKAAIANGSLPSKGPGQDGAGAGTPDDLIGQSQRSLRDACDLAQKTIGNLLVMRREVHITLSIDELKDLWTATFEFLQSVEKISGRSCYGLRSTLLAQAKAFLEHKQEAQMASLVATLDSEKWNQADVSVERQKELTRLASGQAFIPGKLATGTASADGINGEGAVGIAAIKPRKAGKRELSDAVVEGSTFKVVWSVLLLVEMVAANLATAAHFPTLATDVLQRVVELLRLFNSRATQLVLLAGAMHSAARLSKITAKHLALTSQCLGLVMALLPHTRAALSAQLPPKHHLLLVEMDRVKQDYLEHHERILSKFVSIVGEIVESLSNSIGSTDWDRSGGASNCQFIVDSIKNITTMHKVLSAQLPPEQVQEIFSRIFDLLNHKVPDYFASVDPSTPAGQQRVLDDIQYLSHSLDRLRGVSAANLKLEDHFRARFPNAK